jgi:hypothetical protein
MQEASDDLDKLLKEVRRTINDNDQFLQLLMNDSTDVEDEPESSEEGAGGEEEFEEL